MGVILPVRLSVVGNLLPLARLTLLCINLVVVLLTGCSYKLPLVIYDSLISY